MTRLERSIGAVLRAGTLASSSLLAVALLMAMAGARADLAQRLAAAGLVILLATPVARVVVSVVEYVRERDWTFVVLTSIVLLALAASVAAAYL